MTFDEFMEETGSDSEYMLNLLREYISERDLEEDFEEWLRFVFEEVEDIFEGDEDEI